MTDREFVVCLDAGHYGKYNRSPVVSRYYESEVMWKLHLYQKEELEKLGIGVRLTRPNQLVDMDLVARGKASKGANLFISNHSNAAGDPYIDRPEAIYTVDGTSKDIAGILANTVHSTMQTIDRAKTYSRLSSTDRNGDGKKNDDYYGVLFGAHQVGTPALILEHSFHTNKRAATWLLDDSNLRKLAKAEAAAISCWLSKRPTNSVVDKAQSYGVRKAGTYRIISLDGTLNLRAGASTQKPLIEVMSNNSLVKCYGYYTGDWLYVVSANGNVGFCHSGYLSKV